MSRLACCRRCLSHQPDWLGLDLPVAFPGRRRRARGTASTGRLHTDTRARAGLPARARRRARHRASTGTTQAHGAVQLDGTTRGPTAPHGGRRAPSSGTGLTGSRPRDAPVGTDHTGPMPTGMPLRRNREGPRGGCPRGPRTTCTGFSRPTLRSGGQVGRRRRPLPVATAHVHPSGRSPLPRSSAPSRPIGSSR